jgi:hypothetical protein
MILKHKICYSILKNGVPTTLNTTCLGITDVHQDTVPLEIPISVNQSDLALAVCVSKHVCLKEKQAALGLLPCEKNL